MKTPLLVLSLMLIGSSASLADDITPITNDLTSLYEQLIALENEPSACVQGAEASGTVARRMSLIPSLPKTFQGAIAPELSYPLVITSIAMVPAT